MKMRSVFITINKRTGSSASASQQLNIADEHTWPWVILLIIINIAQASAIIIRRLDYLFMELHLWSLYY